MKVMPPLEHAQVLRRLQGELVSAQRMADEAKATVAAAQKREGGCLKRVRDLQSEIEAMSAVRTAAVVSEHALLRWLERHHGLDPARIIEEILAEGTAGAINFVGTGNVKKGERTLVVKDRVVVTVK